MAACIPKGAQGLPEKYPPMVHTVVTHMAQDPTQKPTQSIDLQMLTKLAMPDVAVEGAQALVAAVGGLQAVYRAMQEHQHGAEVHGAEVHELHALDALARSMRWMQCQ